MNKELIKVQDAQKLHAEIMVNQQIMAQSLVTVCKDLKRMRDEKLYNALGCETFEEYSEQMAGIKQRQAYAYISTYEKLGEKFIEENQNLGITKLELVSQVGALDRPELMENVDVESATVKELKEEIKKMRGDAEQMSLDLADAKSENKELKQHLDKAKVDNDLELQKLKDENAELRKKAETGVQEEIDKAITVEKSKIEKTFNNKIKRLEGEKRKAEEQLSMEKKNTIKAQDENKSLKIKMDKITDELTAAKKAAKSAKADEDLLSLKMIFSDLQLNANKMLGLLKKVENKDQSTAEKLSTAIKNYFVTTSDKF